MPRRNSRTSKRVKVTPHVYAMASIVAQRARERQEEQVGFLAGRVLGSRVVTRRMVRALKAQMI